MKFYLISDNVDTMVGMRLAGIDGDLVHEKDEVEFSLKKAIHDKEVGIILITEKLVSISKETVNDLKLNLKTPLILEIPDRHGSGRSKDSIKKYIRDAIGIKV